MIDAGMQRHIGFEKGQDLGVSRDSAETHDKYPFAYIEFRGNMYRPIVTISQDE
jgi:hypothetical protein